MELNRTYNEDCLIGMARIPDGSVDMILCDLPYGTTQCAWDVVIPFDKLWAHYERIIKPNGAIILTAQQPFTSALIMSNPKLFKYCWVWEKSRGSGANAAIQPIRVHEDVCIFYKKQPLYCPQKWQVAERFIDKRRTFNTKTYSDATKGGGLCLERKKDDGTRMPGSVISIGNSGCNIHPTQKPVPLFAYFIRTYTNPGDLVVDNCSGSGTTEVACIDEGRNYICFEKDPDIWARAQERVKLHCLQKAHELAL